jgi:hypothetical protein
MKKKNLIVAYQTPDGELHPVCMAYSHFHLGVDNAAVFTEDQQIRLAIAAVKSQKAHWKGLSRDGAFAIINIDKPHGYSIFLENAGGILAHNYKGQIRRAAIRSINGMSAAAWYEKLRERKSLCVV